MLSFKKNNNPEALIFRFLKLLGIGIDLEVVTDELKKHPHYPSLLSISDVLLSLKVDNSALKVNFEDLANIPCPFITYTSENGGKFVIINQVHDDTIDVVNERQKIYSVPIIDFKKLFEGIVLVAEPSARLGISKKLNNYFASIKPSLITIGLAFTFLSVVLFHTRYISDIDWATAILTLFKSTGLLTSILLLIQSIDGNNPLVQMVCKNNGKTDCNAILSSKAAKVFDGLTWSEVGFFYFSGTLLLLLFGGGTNTTWLTLALLNFISLPYTIYSIYYQAFVAKKWCLLCCTVQGLLWLEFLAIVNKLNKFPFIINDISAFEIFKTCLPCLLTPVLLWLLLKPLLLSLRQLVPLKQQLQKFKYNTDLFYKLLSLQREYIQPDKEWSIVLGNVNSDHVITIISNPYCAPCAKAHDILNDMIDSNDDIQARIIFNAHNTDDDIKTPISRHLMALNEFTDRTIIKKALHEWYGQKEKNYIKWAKGYPVNLDEAFYYKLDKQLEWCKTAELMFTPTILVDGYQLPIEYDLSDLKYMFQ